MGLLKGKPKGGGLNTFKGQLFNDTPHPFVKGTLKNDGLWKRGLLLVWFLKLRVLIHVSMIPRARFVSAFPTPRQARFDSHHP